VIIAAKTLKSNCSLIISSYLVVQSPTGERGGERREEEKLTRSNQRLLEIWVNNFTLQSAISFPGEGRGRRKRKREKRRSEPHGVIATPISYSSYLPSRREGGEGGTILSKKPYCSGPSLLPIQFVKRERKGKGKEKKKEGKKEEKGKAEEDYRLQDNRRCKDSGCS